MKLLAFLYDHRPDVEDVMIFIGISTLAVFCFCLQIGMLVLLWREVMK